MFSYFSARFWSFEYNISSFCVCHHFYHHCVLKYVPLLENFLNILLVVELLIYTQKYFLIYQNKNYSNYKFLIITSPIGFNIALTEVEALLKQRCINIVQRCFHAVSTLASDFALTLCNVENPTSYFV